MRTYTDGESAQVHLLGFGVYKRLDQFVDRRADQNLAGPGFSA
jgi:hypothetical protein